MRNIYYLTQKSKTTQILILIIILFYSHHAIAEKSVCHGKTNIKDIFTEGRICYAKGDYKQAYLCWNRIIDKTPHDNEENDIISTSYSNLGYIVYHGMGTKKDVNKAIALWKKAANLGNLESRKHLGFAYSIDKRNSIYDPVVAYAWFYSALINYNPKEKFLPEENKRIIETVQLKLNELESILSKDAICRAKLFAQQIK